MRWRALADGGQSEIEHLDDAAGVIMTLPGFRSRCTMPFSCAASRASAIWRAMVSASDRHRAALDASAERFARDELHHQRALADSTSP